MSIPTGLLSVMLGLPMSSKCKEIRKALSAISIALIAQLEKDAQSGRARKSQTLLF
jgi:hypothetical protein